MQWASARNVTVILAVTSLVSGMQGIAQERSRWTPSHLADGQPDVQGEWRVSDTGPKGPGFAVGYSIENGAPSEEHVITGGRDVPPPHIVVDPPIPYQPWAKAVRDQNTKNAYNPTKPEHIDSVSRCFSAGVARQSTYTGFQIIQRPGYVFLFYGRSTRTIALDGRPHPDSRITLWMGDSVGHWEGNTLLVNVSNINEYAFFDVEGNFHSNALTMDERWSFVDPNTIEYEVTYTDSKVYTRLWKMVNEFKRNPAADERWEDSCYEGERDVNVMLERNKQP